VGEPSWLQGVVGWSPEGNVLDTFWPWDPAIDLEHSNVEAWREFLDKSNLVVRPGMTPQPITVTLLTPVQFGQVRPHLSLVGQESEAIIAFSLGVRFPGLEAAKPVIELGLWRLPQGFIAGLIRAGSATARMVSELGFWLLSNFMLTPAEKKTCGLDAPRKTSSPPASIDAKMTTENPVAPTSPNGSTDAPTSGQTPTPLAPTASSGSEATGQATSGTPSTTAPERFSAG
jgi:hypothetical protein